MDYDLQLVSNAKSGEAVLRFYQWSPYCISLGANQNVNSINIDKAKLDKLDVVKRPTGGRAILHAEELTYSVIHPLIKPVSPKNLYRDINLALKKGLSIYNNIFSGIELESNQPHFPSFYKEEKSSLCFAVSAKSELNFGGKKLVGSAQRRMGEFILQHGSVLCGDYHKKIVDYLNVHEEEFAALKSELENTTTEIKSVTGENVNYHGLIEALRKGFEEHFGIDFYEHEFHTTFA